MNTNTVRQKYLDFFARKGHKIIASSSLIPIDDPTLLFTCAGMNQFKKEFLGIIADFNKATTSQRCLRTDDLDKVGVTSSHHTFFEMLGNFSFGSYFKNEAVQWALEFLTGKSELGLNADKLWVSVYQDDPEAYDIWHKQGFPRERIVKLGAKDNFWPANAVVDGPNGPCGPCSEIFFDFGKDKGCLKTNCQPGCNCGRFVEIWNLVFTQFNHKDAGVLDQLPNKNIDTGMGLERMASVMQGVKSNFEIDLFFPIMEVIKKLINFPPLTRGDLGGLQTQTRHINAIADHLRAIVFAIYDEVIPSNEGRGYVIRKLIRKADFHGRALGIDEPFLYGIISTISQAYASVYPELRNKEKNIAQVIKSEETAFASTLSEAPKILKIEFEDSSIRLGETAFKVYDTHGVPLEVTKEWLRANSLNFSQKDEDDFLGCLEEQKNRSKKGSKISASVFAEDATLGKIRETEFLGYAQFHGKARILAIIKEDTLTESVGEQEEVQIILDKTPFYGESGGQVGDQGEIKSSSGVFSVTSTLKKGKVILHNGIVKSGKFKTADDISCKIDTQTRMALARAHTATHLLQFALRQVLGPDAKQAGSLVEPDRLRFDFTYPKALTPAQLKEIEAIAIGKILDNTTVNVQELSLDEAKKTGALAFFGEKYEEKVRVVEIGDFSKELCGGTHLQNSSAIGFLKITSESSVAKGVRRIEALTGYAYKAAAVESEEILTQAVAIFSTTKDKLVPSIKLKLEQIEALEKELQSFQFEKLKEGLAGLLDNESNADTKIICQKYENIKIDLLRKAIDFIRLKLKGSYAICLGSCDEAKASIVIALSDDLVKKSLDAGKIAKEIALLIGGSGGGRPNMAQAGGVNTQALESALNSFEEIIKAKNDKCQISNDK